MYWTTVRKETQQLANRGEAVQRASLVSLKIYQPRREVLTHFPRDRLQCWPSIFFGAGITAACEEPECTNLFFVSFVSSFDVLHVSLTSGPESADSLRTGLQLRHSLASIRSLPLSHLQPMLGKGVAGPQL